MEKLNKKTTYGSIDISKDAIAVVVGDEVTSSYGVAGLTAKSNKDDFDILSAENYKKGISIKNEGKSYVIDIHIAIIFPTKVTEIINEVQKKVKYVLEKTFSIKFNEINVYVDGLLINN